MLRIVPIIFATLLLSACSLTSLDRGERQMMTLPSLQTDLQETQPLKNNRLVIDFPETEGHLDTYRIALVLPNGTSDYYARKRWVDFLPVIVQNSLAETLQNARIYRFVKTDAHGLGDDLILKPTIRKFEALYDVNDAAPPIAVIEMDFSLQDVATSRKLDGFSLLAEAPATSNNAEAIHDAFKLAYKDIQIQLLERLD